MQRPIRSVRLVPNVREKMRLSQQAFAKRFRINLARLNHL